MPEIGPEKKDNQMRKLISIDSRITPTSAAVLTVRGQCEYAATTSVQSLGCE
jgi:hypothetical protein